MSIIDALNWRYATKRMNGNIIPKEKMELILKAITLAKPCKEESPKKALLHDRGNDHARDDQPTR